MGRNGKPKYESAAQKGGNPYEEGIFEAAIQFLNSREGVLYTKNAISRYRKQK